MKTSPLQPAAPEGASSLRQSEAGRIEISLRDINQLFNSMDPSPFHEKDLDHDAEEFILSWAQEFHKNDPLTLIIHLERPAEQKVQERVQEAVRHYFEYRARLSEMEFRRLMREGRTSLIIAGLFFGGCLLASEILKNTAWSGGIGIFLRESLMIAGTVAMWKPMQLYLYDWWPLRGRWATFRKLSRMPVQVVVTPARAG